MAAHDQPGGFDFDTFLQGPIEGDMNGPSTDFTAVDQINGAVTLWASHLDDANAQEMYSGNSDESDVEMTSDVDAVHDNIPEGEDQDMVDDDENKICYGMVSSLLWGMGKVDVSSGSFTIETSC